MSELENVDIKNWDKNCVVCGKSGPGEGDMTHIRAGDRMIALCCPMCIEIFSKNAKEYLSWRPLHPPHQEQSS